MAFEFLVLVSRQLGVAHRRHLDMNVDAVEQRAGNTHPVALQLLCRTLADMLWVVGKATHASVGIAGLHYLSRLTNHKKRYFRIERSLIHRRLEPLLLC